MPCYLSFYLSNLYYLSNLSTYLPTLSIVSKLSIRYYAMLCYTLPCDAMLFYLSNVPYLSYRSYLYYLSYLSSLSICPIYPIRSILSYLRIYLSMYLSIIYFFIFLCIYLYKRLSILSKYIFLHLSRCLATYPST